MGTLKQKSMSKTLGQFHEFAMKLQQAGFKDEWFQKIISSKDNKLAKDIVMLLSENYELVQKTSSKKLIETSEFFKDGHNGIFKTDFSSNFKNIFQSMLNENFEKLTEKPDVTIMTNRLNDYEIMEKYSDAVSSPIELAQKFHYVMILDLNTVEGKEARNGKSYFGFFKDKNGALHFVNVYWDSNFGEWNGHCYPVDDNRWRVGGRLFRKTES